MIHPNSSTSPAPGQGGAARNFRADTAPTTAPKPNTPRPNESLDKSPLVGQARREFEKRTLDRPDVKGPLQIAVRVLLGNFHRGKADSYASNTAIHKLAGNPDERTVVRWIALLEAAGIIAVFLDNSIWSRRRIVFVEHPNAPAILRELRSNRHVQEIHYARKTVGARVTSETIPVDAGMTSVSPLHLQKMSPLHPSKSEPQVVTEKRDSSPPDASPLLRNVLTLQTAEEKSSSNSVSLSAKGASENEKPKPGPDDDFSASLEEREKAKPAAASKPTRTEVKAVPLEAVQKMRDKFGDDVVNELNRSAAQFWKASQGKPEVIVAAARATVAQKQVEKPVGYMLDLVKKYATEIPPQWRQDAPLDPAKDPEIEKKAREWIRNCIATCQREGHGRHETERRLFAWIVGLNFRRMDGSAGPDGKGESGEIINLMLTRWIPEEMATCFRETGKPNSSPGEAFVKARPDGNPTVTRPSPTPKPKAVPESKPASDPTPAKPPRDWHLDQDGNLNDPTKRDLKRRMPEFRERTSIESRIPLFAAEQTYEASPRARELIEVYVRDVLLAKEAPAITPQIREPILAPPVFEPSVLRVYPESVTQMAEAV